MGGVVRSSYYYEPVPESELNLRLMKIIDQEYIIAPFYGYRKMTEELKKKGEWVNKKRILRLMKIMGLEAMYPKPRISIGDKNHYKFPYLLNNIKINHIIQVNRSRTCFFLVDSKRGLILLNCSRSISLG